MLVSDFFSFEISLNFRNEKPSRDHDENVKTFVGNSLECLVFWSMGVQTTNLMLILTQRLFYESNAMFVSEDMEKKFLQREFV